MSIDTEPALTRPAMIQCGVCEGSGRYRGGNCPHPNCKAGYVTIPAAEVVQAFERSGLDLGACSACGRGVIGLPDGLAICEPCHVAEATDAN